MILLIDNYDSFTYNLAHLFGELGAEVVVRRNDAITVEEAERLAPTHLVVSPGPGRPEDAGVSEEMVRAFAGRVPTLGVCLGHQAIVEVFGGEVGAGASGSSTARRPTSTTTGAASSPAAARTSRPAATTRSRRRRSRTRSRSRRRAPTAR